MTLNIGDKVRKLKGYTMVCYVSLRGITRKGHTRIVVEVDDPGGNCDGLLFIGKEEDFELLERAP